MPDKSPDAFRTISEVADWLGVQPHVLRFWESKFSQVRPVKRAGGRRYYRPNDMLLLGGIRKLLHEDGLTIKGAQKVLREEGMSHVARLSQPLDAESAAFSDLMAEGETEPGGAPHPEPVEPSEEHGNVVSFGSPQPATDEDGQPEADIEGVSRPDLSGTPTLKIEREVGNEDRPASPQPADPPERTATDERGESREEQDETKVPMPSFRRSSAGQKPTEPERSSRETGAPKPAASDRLPSFLQHPPPMREPSEAAPQETPSHADKAGAEPPAVPKPQERPAPKPRIVDAADPDESAFAVAPGALSACYGKLRLTTDQRAEALPLVGRMAALRDRMATARGR